MAKHPPRDIRSIRNVFGKSYARQTPGTVQQSADRFFTDSKSKICDHPEIHILSASRFISWGDIMEVSIIKRSGAEFIGTFWLVVGGCGSAVFAAAFPVLGIGFLGVSLAFGLTLLTMAFAIGHISGCHLNPAVSVGLTVGGRFPAKDLAPYIIAQVLGGIAAAAVIYFIATGKADYNIATNGLAANGYGEHSPGGYSLTSAFVTEVVMTLMFVFIILGATDKLAPAGFAGIPIGFTLTLIHLISIPITNTSVNPARSTGPAVFVQGWAIEQLWLFWLAPILGAIIGGVLYRTISSKHAPA